MNLEIMNELVKKDLSDIAQVNVINWPIIGWLKGWFPLFDIDAWNNGLAEYGPSIIILLTIAITTFKGFRIVQHYRWERKDRAEELAD